MEDARACRRRYWTLLQLHERIPNSVMSSDYDASHASTGSPGDVHENSTDKDSVTSGSDGLVHPMGVVLALYQWIPLTEYWDWEDAMHRYTVLIPVFWTNLRVNVPVEGVFLS